MAVYKHNVIIPALNEATTIGPIIRIFRSHPDISEILVVTDVETTDFTHTVALNSGAMVHRSFNHGKGELITEGFKREFRNYPEANVILCDADYTGFTSDSISKITQGHRPWEMIIGYPRYPTDQEWAEEGIPNLPLKRFAWQAMSGFRSVPAQLLQHAPLHGYLTETQLNNRALDMGINVKFVYCEDIVAPLRFTPRRMKAMEEDRIWGFEHGILR